VAIATSALNAKAKVRESILDRPRGSLKNGSGRAAAFRRRRAVRAESVGRSRRLRPVNVSRGQQWQSRPQTLARAASEVLRRAPAPGTRRCSRGRSARRQASGRARRCPNASKAQMLAARLPPWRRHGNRRASRQPAEAMPGPLRDGGRQLPAARSERFGAWRRSISLWPFRPPAIASQAAAGVWVSAGLLPAVGDSCSAGRNPGSTGAPPLTGEEAAKSNSVFSAWAIGGRVRTRAST